MAILIGLVALMYFTVGIVFIWFVSNPGNIQRMKRRWEQRRLMRRRLRGQPTGREQEVFGENYRDEAGGEGEAEKGQEETEQCSLGPKSDIDKKTD